MPKPITVILHDKKIVAAFESYDDAVKKFKSLELEGGEISLHVLNRPDRKKKNAPLKPVSAVSEKPNPKKNIV